jgi:hypothetical protein
MELHSGHDKLDDAGGLTASKKVGSGRGLHQQQVVFEIMPDLDYYRDVPPGVSPASESRLQYDQANEHNQGIAIV